MLFYFNVFICLQQTRNQFFTNYCFVFCFKWQDALLDKHIAEGSFGGEVRQLGRPVKSLVVRKLFPNLCLLFLQITFSPFCKQYFGIFAEYREKVKTIIKMTNCFFPCYLTSIWSILFNLVWAYEKNAYLRLADSCQNFKNLSGVSCKYFKKSWSSVVLATDKILVSFARNEKRKEDFFFFLF